MEVGPQEEVFWEILGTAKELILTRIHCVSGRTRVEQVGGCAGEQGCVGAPVFHGYTASVHFQLVQGEFAGERVSSSSVGVEWGGGCFAYGRYWWRAWGRCGTVWSERSGLRCGRRRRWGDKAVGFTQSGDIGGGGAWNVKRGELGGRVEAAFTRREGMGMRG